MAPASLQLLKNAAKAKPAPAPEPAPVTAEVETVVDVDKLDAAELDNLVEENQIETPAEWSGWGEDEKRAWLKSQFEETDEVPAEPAPAAKAKKGGKKAKKAAEAPADDDVIASIVHEVENLKKKEALDLAANLDEATQFGLFKLGGVFAKVKREKWYDPYPTFKAWAQGEHGVDSRTTSYWVSTYNAMAQNGVPWSKVEKIGWTKLSVIASIITVDNVDEWVNVASKNNVTTLKKYVEEAEKNEGNIPSEGSVQVKTALVFQMHADQIETVNSAIAKCMEATGTAHKAVAIDYICQEYLSGKHPPLDLPAVFKTLGWEKVLEIAAATFPEIDISASEAGADKESEAA